MTIILLALVKSFLSVHVNFLYQYLICYQAVLTKQRDAPLQHVLRGISILLKKFIESHSLICKMYWTKKVVSCHLLRTLFGINGQHVLGQFLFVRLLSRTPYLTSHCWCQIINSLITKGDCILISFIFCNSNFCFVCFV